MIFSHLVNPLTLNDKMKNTKIFILPLRAGNSLVEYALPLGLLVVVVLLGAGLVGSNLNQGIPTMANGTMVNEGSAKSLRLRPLGSNPFTQTIQLTLSDGSSLALENYPTDIKSLVETLGPNGTTDLLADSLKSLAKQLLSQGKITPDQANTLMKLSNHGHSWARTQGFFEDAVVESEGDKARFEGKVKPILDELYNSTRFVTPDRFDSEVIKLFKMDNTYSAVKLDAQGLALKGANGMYAIDSSTQLKAYYIPVQVEFANAYTEASKSGALQDPVVKQVVASLSQNIFSIGSLTIASAVRVLTPAFQLKPSDLNLTVKQELDGNSSNICAAGGGKDTGVYCPSNKQNRGGV
jgi:hypothetical protein